MTESTRVLPTWLLSLSCAALTLGACDHEPPEPAHPPGLVLVVDGIEIFESDLEPLLAYAQSVDKRTGRMTVIGGILDHHVLPTKLAQRAFQKERAQQLELAEGLASAIGNGSYLDLTNKAKHVSSLSESAVLRHEIPLTLAAWAFEPENVARVSPILESPQGYSLVSTYHLQPGVTRVTDRADICQVSFYTHGPDDFGAWLVETKRTVADKVTFVNPEYRRAIPPWLEIP